MKFRSIFFVLTTLISSALSVDAIESTLPSLIDIMKKTDLYYKSRNNEIRAELADSSKSCYVAYAFVTLPLKFEKAAPYFMNIENYEYLFKYIVKMHNIKDITHPKDSLYYIEGKSYMVHGWGLGRLEELKLYPDSLINLKIRPASKWITNQYRAKKKGEIKYYVKDVFLDGKLIKVDDNHCRIGIRGVTTTNTPMPQWLVSIIMKIIFPGLINDAVKKINSGWVFP